MQRNSFWCTKKPSSEVEISFEWRAVKQGDNQADLLFLKNTFMKSFLDGYKDFTAEMLKLEPGVTKEKLLEDYIDKELKEMKSDHNMHYLIVRVNDMPAGFAICHPNIKTGNVYLSTLAVSPILNKKFGLGTETINAIKKRYSDFNGIDLATRLINSARTFYEKLGFVAKTPASLHLDFSPEKYIGYERSHRAQESKETPVKLTRSHSVVGLDRFRP